MRKRFQKGSLQKVRGEWVARWRQNGERKARKVGRVSQVTKAQAQSELAAILAPINSARSEPSEKENFGDFVQHVYLPFYQRKWKRSTIMTNEDRLTRALHCLHTCIDVSFFRNVTPSRKIDQLQWSYHAVMASSNRRARSSGLAGRGDNFVTLCCGSVPSTSLPISIDA